MNDYRSILALLSGAVGIVLLIAAIRRSGSTKVPVVRSPKRATATLWYAALFLIVGALLWWRRDASPEPMNASPVEATLAPMPNEPGELSSTEHDTAPSLAPDSVASDAAPSPSVSVRRPPPFHTRLPRTPPEPSPLPWHGLRLPSVTFDPGTADLSGANKVALQQLAADLKQRPDLKIEVQGYVDSLGSDANNFALAQTRASTIRDFLVVKGVAASRVNAQAFGNPSSSEGLIAFVVRR